MIYGFLHQGSGLGNQLHRYVALRIKAKELGVDWRVIYNPDNSGKSEGFKGASFMKFDTEKILYSVPSELKEWNEKGIRENGIDIRSYDPEFNFIEDETLMEGEFQDERYWEDKEKEVNEWLKVEPMEMPDNLCVIGFRGGEYSIFPDLFLESSYWIDALYEMRKINPNMVFEVHTDDPQLAQQYFPHLPVIHDIGINWRSMRYAKYAIIANSSFFIFPRWISGGYTIAPRWWARHNIRVWASPSNFYRRFRYI